MVDIDEMNVFTYCTKPRLADYGRYEIIVMALCQHFLQFIQNMVSVHKYKIQSVHGDYRRTCGLSTIRIFLKTGVSGLESTWSEKVVLCFLRLDPWRLQQDRVNWNSKDPNSCFFGWSRLKTSIWKRVGIASSGKATTLNNYLQCVSAWICHVPVQS